MNDNESNLSANEHKIFSEFFHNAYINCTIMKINKNITHKKNMCDVLYEEYYKHEKMFDGLKVKDEIKINNDIR